MVFMSILKIILNLFVSEVATQEKKNLLPFSAVPTPSVSKQLARILEVGRGNFRILDHVPKMHKELGPIYKENLFPGIQF